MKVVTMFFSLGSVRLELVRLLLPVLCKNVHGIATVYTWQTVYSVGVVFKSGLMTLFLTAVSISISIIFTGLKVATSLHRTHDYECDSRVSAFLHIHSMALLLRFFYDS